jgi:hypothetical protein
MVNFELIAETHTREARLSQSSERGIGILPMKSVRPDVIGEHEQAGQDRKHENNDDDRFGSVFVHRQRI